MVGTGEGAGLDGGKSCEERRVLAGGEEVEEAFTIVGMSTASGGIVTEKGAIEACMAVRRKCQLAENPMKKKIGSARTFDTWPAAG